MGADRIARITTDGYLTEFPLPHAGAIASMITAGSDGALWFILNQAQAVSRLSLGGDIAIYPLPTPDAGPVGIAAASDAISFVEIAAGQVGRISLNGRIREFALPDRTGRPPPSSTTTTTVVGSVNGETAASPASPRTDTCARPTCQPRASRTD